MGACSLAGLPTNSIRELSSKLGGRRSSGLLLALSGRIATIGGITLAAAFARDRFMGLLPEPSPGGTEWEGGWRWAAQ